MHFRKVILCGLKSFKISDEVHIRTHTNDEKQRYYTGWVHQMMYWRVSTQKFSKVYCMHANRKSTQLSAFFLLILIMFSFLVFCDD